MYVTGREALNAVMVGLTLAVTLRDLYPEDWQPEKLQTLLVNRQAFTALRSRQGAADISTGWADDLAVWAGRASAFRLYE